MDRNLSYVPAIDNDRLYDWIDREFAGLKHIYVLKTALELDVFDTLLIPRDLDEACDKLGIEHVTGKLLLDSLVDMGFLVREDGDYADTEMSEDFLTSDSFMDMRHRFDFTVRNLEHWQNLTGILRDGQPVLMMADIYRPEKLASFLRSGAGGSIGRMIDIFGENVDMDSAGSFLSIGASGALCAIAVNQRYPGIDACVLEHPRFQEAGRELAEEYDSPVRMLSGDYHEGLQGEYGVVFSSLTHACMETGIAAQLAAGVRDGGILVVRRNTPEFSLDPLRDLDVNLTRLEVMEKGSLHHHGDEYGREYIARLRENGLYLTDRKPFSMKSEVLVFRKGA